MFRSCVASHRPGLFEGRRPRCAATPRESSARPSPDRDRGGAAAPPSRRVSSPSGRSPRSSSSAPRRVARSVGTASRRSEPRRSRRPAARRRRRVARLAAEAKRHLGACPLRLEQFVEQREHFLPIGMAATSRVGRVREARRGTRWLHRGRILLQAAFENPPFFTSPMNPAGGCPDHSRPRTVRLPGHGKRALQALAFLGPAATPSAPTSPPGSPKKYGTVAARTPSIRGSSLLHPSSSPRSVCRRTACARRRTRTRGSQRS